MPTLKLLFFFLLAQPLFAQNFVESTKSIFDPVYIGAVDFLDADGDGDQDVIVSGNTSPTDPAKQTSLYFNDGLGTFEMASDTLFEGVTFGDISHADVDMDGDEDVLISGLGLASISVAKLHLNDGNGNFLEVVGTPFEGVHTSSTLFTDVDGDGDPDCIIAGIDNANFGITKLYFNDGAGNYSEAIGTPFLGVVDGSIAVADVDGDDDQDLIVVGVNSPAIMPGRIAKLYLNDGTGTFTEKANTPFDPSLIGSVDFADVDGDGDPDVLITGRNNDVNPATYIATLYTNDGLGNYSEVLNTPFKEVVLSDAAFADVDGDDDLDLLITGRSSMDALNVERQAVLYINDGTGTFSELSGTPFESVDFSAVGFADVDGDNDQDVLITGSVKVGTRNSTPITKLYINEPVTSSSDLDKLDFSLYPNPIVDDRVNLTFVAEDKNALSISILDLHGRVLNHMIGQAQIGENSYSFDVSHLSNGIYLFKVVDGDKVGVQQIVVQ